MSSNHQDKVGNYKSTHNMTIDNRSIDAQALLNCASRLRIAIDGKGKDMMAYGDAVRYNQRLWTVFRVALSEPDNPLPTSLKNTLFDLGRYIDRVSFQAVMSYSPEILDGLINLNRMIAAGLQKAQPSAPNMDTSSMQGSSAPVAGVMTSA